MLATLKAETSAIHRKLESRLDIFRPGFDQRAYTQLLTRFYGLYAAWEPWAIHRISGALPGFFHDRSRLTLLQADLARLGAQPHDLAAIPLCQSLALPRSAAFAIGGAYVFEGSTLGGQILSRHFRKTLGVTETSGCAFFSAYGENTAHMWRLFGETVEEFARNTSAHDEILIGAKDTFASILEWFPPSGSRK